MSYAFYFTGSGTGPGARLVHSVKLGTEADRLADDPPAGCASVGVPDPYVLPDDAALAADQRWRRTIDEATGVITHTAVARGATALAAQLALRKRGLIDAQMDTFRWDRTPSDATLAAAATRLQAIAALSSLSDPDPAAITEDADPDGFRFFDRVYRRGNVVGTVSRGLAGRVTGALIEEGANVNGGYVRLAGGFLGSVQVCWTQATTSAAADSLWTYPAAFSVGPAVLITPLEDSLTARAAKVRDRTATAASVVALTLASARVAVDVMLVAVGRWPII